MIDYGLHARQIALPELGARGQEVLSEIAVDLSALPPIARELHERAGGLNAAGVRIEAPGQADLTRAAARPSPEWERGFTRPTASCEAASAQSPSPFGRGARGSAGEVSPEGAAFELGVAAWGCVEAARRVLGESARPMPEALIARLGALK